MSRKVSRYAELSKAVIRPNAIRYLASVLKENGFDSEHLFKGTGFSISDLQDTNFQLSYRQGSIAIKRAQKLFKGTGLGLLVGSRQTLVSWGLVGFGMMASSSVRDAAKLAIFWQRQLGSFLAFDLEESEGRQRLILHTDYADPEILQFLVEEAFSSVVSVIRQLVGPNFRPISVECSYSKPANTVDYLRFFSSSIAFDRPENILEVDNLFMNYPIATRDDVVAKQIWDLLNALQSQDQSNFDLITTVERAVRSDLTDIPPIVIIADSLNISERTLRRRLLEIGVSYQDIIDNSRKLKALELLSNKRFTISEIAAVTGFSDARNFRRAFRRWTGLSPSELRTSVHVVVSATAERF